MNLCNTRSLSYLFAVCDYDQPSRSTAAAAWVGAKIDLEMQVRSTPPDSLALDQSPSLDVQPPHAKDCIVHPWMAGGSALHA